MVAKIRIPIKYKFFCVLSIIVFNVFLPILNNTVHADDDKLSVNTILQLTNTERANLKLQTLEINESLTEIAESRLEDMKKNNYFGHKNNGSHGIKFFLEKTKYNYIIAGENLAINYFDNEEVMNAWMNSPTHKKNILKPIYRDMGISFDYIEINGTEKLVVVIIFGREI